MKTMKRFLLLVVASFSLMSCSFEGDNYYGPEIDYTYITVAPHQWVSEGIPGGYRLKASFSTSMITDIVIERGVISVYDVYETDVQLPYTIMDPGYIVRAVGYEVSPGRIQFTIESSNLAPVVPSGNVKYKVVVMH